MNPLTEDQSDLIERIGVLHDRMDLRPAAGRIIGLLLVTPEGELTFDEIREALQLSKSATSTALQYLQDMGSVVYRTHPGDRKRYFRKEFRDWERSFAQRGLRYLDIRFLLEEAREVRGNTDPETDRGFDHMIDFLHFLAGTIQEALDQWQTKVGSDPGRPAI